MPYWWNIIKRAIAANINDNAPAYVVVDVETGAKGKKVHDIGAIRSDGAVFHENSRSLLSDFIAGTKYICGHNIVHHDAKYLFDSTSRYQFIDTLYLSPLLFPEHPYHKLVKDDKLIVDELNNPVNDCKKAETLLLNEIERWDSISPELRLIFASLLKQQPEFSGFLNFVNATYADGDLSALIVSAFHNKICHNADITTLATNHPCALAYALALINTTDHRSITPPWVLHNYPAVEYILKKLRHTRCQTGCSYCNNQHNIHKNLKQYFGYNSFRTYEGEPLQEKAAAAAIDGKSLLAIFPTGGGKSLTFQLPALMSGRAVHGLTVVISPLQSLMKDQVDNLADRGITDAVTINGQLDPITRKNSIERVVDGTASILYISPEMLRSRTVERILLSRNVVRFVIDEAHCFSSWGHDFRVDYLYIGKFIANYQQKKHTLTQIPVSCFTATAKQKVIQDICDYFKRTLNTDLTIFATSASRTNLHYAVIHADNDDDKYTKLRALISENHCSTIVYVSRTKRTYDLANKLNRDGFPALPFNGRMKPEDKIANQDAFMSDKVPVIVATSAFGMGVDKKDVQMVIHYDISDSLENYVQEAGRAGRDPGLNARCYVLYSDNDLDKHFILLNQTKLSISEIQQIWKAVKDLTRYRERTNSSALEIARLAGWDDSVYDIETRVRTALAALEQGGYIERGNNMPHVYATGITVRNMDEARQRISASLLFDKNDLDNAVRIIKSLISKKYTSQSVDAEGETRIDYLADTLGLTRREIISAVERMRQDGILADTKDMSAYLADIGDTERKSLKILDDFSRLEQYIFSTVGDRKIGISYKQLNAGAQNRGIGTSNEKNIRTLLNFLSTQGYIHLLKGEADIVEIQSATTTQRSEKRMAISRFAIKWLYRQASSPTGGAMQPTVQFSVVELLSQFTASTQSLFDNSSTQIADIEDALLYLSKIGALKLEGGFLVLYNAMDIRRIKDTKARYRQDDYRTLDDFYRHKIQQVHIVGEYANLMVKDYNAALRYVQDYFQMDYKKFISKYFKGERDNEIQRNLSPQKYRQLFSQLSKTQMSIISDKESRCIVVAAGPGSGKTRLLVHKLASLLMLEDVKHEQLLMLTFSRAAATEFKQRLMALIGNAAHFVDILTFHSFCFNILGQTGNIDDMQNIVEKATIMIENGEVEQNRIGKTVLVIDEAQDMSIKEYNLVKALIERNEEMRIIAVGDDDQNIYEFRESDSQYFFQLSKNDNTRFVEMTENYRSARHIVDFANHFALNIHNRLKTTPIVSMHDADGQVNVTRHSSEFIYLPLVNELIANKHNGSTCILTNTNREASTTLALLRKQGIKCKLIQSLDGFRIYNIVEIRYFFKQLKQNCTTPLITDTLWDNAKHATLAKYSRSTALTHVKRCIETFEQTNKTKYLNDFFEFIFESSVEDFSNIPDTGIVISTIHKSKGREFDNVYMLISNRYTINDPLLRRYYVGITRTKTNLHVHTNSNCFDNLPVNSYTTDNTQYTLPSEIVIQLTYHDVYLDFFISIKNEVLSLQSGDVLTYDDYTFFNPLTNQPVAKLSSTMRKQIDKEIASGYRITQSTVHFIVAWKPKDAPANHPPTAVLLPTIHLTLNNGNC